MERDRMAARLDQHGNIHVPALGDEDLLGDKRDAGPRAVGLAAGLHELHRSRTITLIQHFASILPDVSAEQSTT
jgi:hypothetical protein